MTHPPIRRRPIHVLLAPALGLTLTVTGTAVLASPASAAVEDTPADVLPSTTEVRPGVAPVDMPAAGTAQSPFSADPLPTVQHDGVAREQLVVGDTVYVMGDFDNARPAGTGTTNVPRANMLAYDVTTGRLLPDFAPVFDGPTWDAVASADGRWLYVVGAFERVGGEGHYRIARIDAATGAVDRTFRAGTNAAVRTIARTGDTLYLGGVFGDVSGAPRARLGAIDARTGAVLPWNPGADKTVNALDVSPDGTRLIIGGDFVTVGGRNAPGLALVDTATGDPLPMSVTTRLKSGGNQASVTSVKADAEGFAATGFVWGGGTGNWEGTLRGRWDGSLAWYADTYGDNYDVQVVGDRVVSVGHAHDLSNIGGAPEVDPQRFYRAVMYTDEVATTTKRNVYLQRADLSGMPAPGIAAFFPAMNPGPATGAWQAAWTVEATDDYLLLGGEFVDVQGKAQQGLVRLPRRGTAERQGPTFVDAAPRLEGRSDGSVGITFSRAADPDDAALTYTVEREGAVAPVLRATMTTPHWDPGVTELIDRAAPAGTTARYRVRVADPWGNEDVTGWTSVTVPVAGSTPGYAERVAADGAAHHWRLDETSGRLAGATVGPYDLESRGGTSGGETGVPGTGGTSWAFSGDAYGVTRPLARQRPTPGTTLTAEAWFRPESGTDGELVTYAPVPGKWGAHPQISMYLDTSGALRAAHRTGTTTTVAASTGTIEPWAWHHAVAEWSPTGIRLYLDGELVATASGSLTMPGWSGGWRLAGGEGTPFPGAATTTYQGRLDEVAVYPTSLDAATVAAHHALGAGRPAQEGTDPEPAPEDPAATGGAVLIDEPFDRRIGTGWGGPWSTWGPASVDGAAARLTLAPTSGPGARRTDVTAADQVTDVVLSLDELPTANLYATLVQRRTAQGQYETRVMVRPDGSLQLQLRRNVGGTSTVLGTREVPGLRLSPGVKVHLRSSTVGAEEVDLTASLWAEGEAEPAEPLLSARDTAGGLAAPGTLALETWLGGAREPVVLSVDSWRTAEPTPEPMPEPTPEPTPEAGPAFADDFGRTLATGWGAAPTGGGWATWGTTSVDGATGLLTTPAGRGSGVRSTQTAVRDQLTRFDMTVEQVPTATLNLTVGQRAVGSDRYEVRLVLTPQGTVRATLVAAAGGTTRQLAATELPARVTAGTTLHVEVGAVGEGTTEVTAKVWADGETEPAVPQLRAQDATPALQRAGTVGVETYLGGAATAPVVLRFDDWATREVAAR